MQHAHSKTLPLMCYIGVLQWAMCSLGLIMLCRLKGVLLSVYSDMDVFNFQRSLKTWTSLVMKNLVLFLFVKDKYAFSTHILNIWQSWLSLIHGLFWVGVGCVCVCVNRLCSILHGCPQTKLYCSLNIMLQSLENDFGKSQSCLLE